VLDADERIIRMLAARGGRSNPTATREGETRKSVR
jgi:hypothetical protein